MQARLRHGHRTKNVANRFVTEQAHQLKESEMKDIPHLGENNARVPT